jgi:hypothetical protein
MKLRAFSTNGEEILTGDVACRMQILLIAHDAIAGVTLVVTPVAFRCEAFSALGKFYVERRDP